jgi:hypothetical protein
VHNSDGRSPWRNATRIMVASRCPWRPRLRAASLRSSTSLTVRYSRGRRFRLTIRRGGTVPFAAIGACRRLPFLPLFFRVLDRMTVQRRGSLVSVVTPAGQRSAIRASRPLLGESCYEHIPGYRVCAVAMGQTRRPRCKKGRGKLVAWRDATRSHAPQSAVTCCPYGGSEG